MEISNVYGKTENRKNPKIMSKQKTRDLIFYICLVFLPCLQFVVFWVGTNFETIALAVQSYDAATNKYYFVGLDNFVNVFKGVLTNIDLPKAIWNGAIYQILSYIIVWPLSLLFSFYVYKKRFGSSAVRSILFLPSLVGGTAMLIIYIYFTENLIPDIWYNIFHQPIVSSGGLLSNEGTVFGTILFNLLWFSYGANILLYSSTMSQVDASLVESAHLDGANDLQEFWHIVLPHLWGLLTVYLSSGACMFLMTDLGLYGFFEFNAPTNVYTLGYYMTQQTLGVGVASYPMCSALSLLVSFVAIPISLLVRKLCNKYGPSED